MWLHSAIRLASIALLGLWISVQGAFAVTLLRDADLEYGLKQLASPILQAAGLSPNRVKILVVDDRSLNAFVVSQDAIFVHSGLLTRLTSASQLQAVIAHEAAHIANGHLTRRMTNLRAARTAAGLGIALAAAAVASGGGEGAAAAGIGISSSALRQFFKHTRAEESAADAAALRYMRSAGVPSSGLLEVMQIFRGQEVLAETRQDPYVRSHPLSRDRIRAIQARAGTDKTLTEAQASSYWFARVKGKLTAHTRSPKWTLGRAGESGYSDLKAMRQAVAYDRQSATRKALRAVDTAISQRPKDAYFHDLKGEILMRSRNFKAAAASYAQAARLAPNDGLVLAGLGRALLADGQTKAALGYLEKARRIDYRDGIMLRDLTTAYAKLGQNGMAALVSAERYALRGDLETAGIHAKRASDLLATGSGPWQRAQDVLIASDRVTKQKRNR